MNPVQIVKYQQRKKVIIGLGIVFTGLWLLLVFYWLTGNKQTIPSVPAAQVTVHAPSPVATGSTPAATFRSSRRVAPLIHHSAATPSWSYVQSAPKATMGSTSIRIHLTSSATVHSIGGGGGGGALYTTSGGGNSGKGIRTTSSSISFGGNLLALSASTSLASPGAKEAKSIATTTQSASQQASGSSPRRLPGHEEEWWLEETPVGDVAWGWMLLLTIAWCVRVRLSKRQ